MGIQININYIRDDMNTTGLMLSLNCLCGGTRWLNALSVRPSQALKPDSVSQQRSIPTTLLCCISPCFLSTNSNCTINKGGKAPKHIKRFHDNNVISDCKLSTKCLFYNHIHCTFGFAVYICLKKWISDVIDVKLVCPFNPNPPKK